jgi:hypothetical protein
MRCALQMYTNLRHIQYYLLFRDLYSKTQAIIKIDNSAVKESKSEKQR